MGNAAVAGELASTDELDELYRLDASEGEPEPGDDEPDDDEEEDDDEGDDDGGIKPEDMPHP
jgi:hypothetical protein